MRKNNRQRLSGIRRIFAALVILTVLSGTLTAAALAAPLPPERDPAANPPAVSETVEQQPVLHIHHAKGLGSDQDEIQVTILGKKYTGTLKRDVITIPVEESSRFPDLDPDETAEMAFVNLTTGLEGTLTVECETGPDGTKKVTDDHVLAHFRCTTATADTDDGTLLLVSEEEPAAPADKPAPPEPGEKPARKSAPKDGPKDGPKAGPKADAGLKDGPKGPAAEKAI